MKFNENTFAWLLISIILLNYVDAFLTLSWVSTGFAVETNPIMNGWLDLGAIPFLCVKLLFVIVASYLLWMFRKNKLAHTLVFGVFLLYLCVFFIHCDIAYKIFVNSC
jgi:hypothetical protein